MELDFKKRIEKINPQLLKLQKLETLQVNMGNLCNQTCIHCHIQGGPDGQKQMSREVMEEIINFLAGHRELNVDITGGCPELNPDFRFFIENIYDMTISIIVRTNLSVLLEPGLEWVSKWYSDHNVILIASLPCYTQTNVDSQRGDGVFKKSIAALKMLNELGYGYEDSKEIDLVYNPGAGFLPGPQQQLEIDYKRELDKKFGIKFNKLFTITNAPIGRFRQYLKANGQLEVYLQLLTENFNPSAAECIMCRNIISVDYQGVLYNCDFNQALGLNIVDEAGKSVTIRQLDNMLCDELGIITSDHCFCCTAGSGSSCTGSLVKQKITGG